MTSNFTEPSSSPTFDHAVELAMSLADFERSTHFPGHSDFHLERISLLARRLGDVGQATRTVHVAGTKGKGSTSALITSILTQAGYKVGLFTSPHLHSVCERIRVGLQPVSRDEYARLVLQVWPAVESVGRDGGYGGVTFFELMTAMALVHFRDIGADFQVMEVGLGGRLDATNIVTPQISVITSISLDHVATLGDTIPKIAYEKAGIIKPGVPCVIGPQAEPAAMEVFRQTASERGSDLVAVEDRYSWSGESADLDGQCLTLSGPESVHLLRTPLLGDYQLENVATAVAAVDQLARLGCGVDGDAVAAGVSEVSWPGRFDVFEVQGKTVVVDGAHNPYSARRLVGSLPAYVRFKGVVLLFGALGGHSASGMLSELASLDPSVIAVQSRHPRSSRACVAADAVRDSGLNLVAEADTVAGGFRKALELARADELILCTGSLSVAGEVLEVINGVEPEIYDNLRGPAADLRSGPDFDRATPSDRSA